MRDWEKDGEQGFAFWSGARQEFAVYRVTEKLEVQRIEKTRVLEDKLPWAFQKQLMVWVTKKSFDGKVRFENKENERLETTHNLIVFNKIGQSTIFVCHQVSSPGNRGLIGLTFPEGQIFTYGVQQIIQSMDDARDSERIPHFFVYLDYRHQKKAFSLKIDYNHIQGAESNNSIESYKVHREPMNEKQKEKFYEIGDQRLILKLEDWG